MIFIAIDLDDTPFYPVMDNSNLLHHIWTCSKSNDIINYKEKILSLTDSIKVEFTLIENNIKELLKHINEPDKDFFNDLLKTNINIIDDENLFFNVGFNDTFKLHFTPFIPKVEIDFTTTNEALLTFLDLCQSFTVATDKAGITHCNLIRECASNIQAFIGKLNMCFYILGVTVANKLIN